MKKRLLITSIVMMLVVAVALGTSTYAWFTSNATVSATAITLTADTSEAPSLGISWVDGGYGTSITATSPSGYFNPAAPLTLSTTGTKTDSTVGFFTALATPVNNGPMVFAANGASTDVYTWTDTTHNSFFLKNLSPSNPISSVTISATISDVTGEANVGANKLIRVGVFKYNSTSSKYELLGVLANQESVAYTPVEEDATLDDATTYYKLYLGKYVVADKGTSDDVTAKTADYYNGMEAPADTFYTAAAGTTPARAVYGEIASGEDVNDMPSIACVTSIDLGGLAAGTTMELVVKVWEDAVALGDAEQSKAASIALGFLAA